MPTLLIIDIQRDYFPGGAFPLVDPEPAAARGLRGPRPLPRARTSRWSTSSTSGTSPTPTFMRPGHRRGRDPPTRSPRPTASAVIEKDDAQRLPRHRTSSGPSAPARTRTLVVAGMMSSMCVDATVRAAVDLGLRRHGGPRRLRGSRRWSSARSPCRGEQVHAAFMAALSDYGSVVSADELIAD